MLNFIRSLRKKRAERIIDRSHMRTAPERAPMHAIFCALYAIATFSVLWQHCHPYISILILALIAPISLAAWVPYSKFSLNKRFILQLILICTAVLWAYYRFGPENLRIKSASNSSDLPGSPSSWEDAPATTVSSSSSALFFCSTEHCCRASSSSDSLPERRSASF